MAHPRLTAFLHALPVAAAALALLAAAPPTTGSAPPPGHPTAPSAAYRAPVPIAHPHAAPVPRPGLVACRIIGACPPAKRPPRASGPTAPAPTAFASDYERDWNTDPAGYTYYATGDDGEGAYWTTCRPLTYQLAVTGLTDEQTARLRDTAAAAVASVTARTNQAIEFAGYTSTVAWASDHWWQPDPAPGADILISALTAEQAPVLAGNAAVTGNTVTSDGPGGAPTGIVRCGIAVDRAQLSSADPQRLRTILIHELGHALGLGHTDSVRQLMNIRPHTEPTWVLQAGDRAGISMLRSTHPCG